MPQALALPLFGLVALSLPAYAQSGSAPGISLGNSLYGSAGTSTLRNPLVPGAQFSLPGIPATQGAIPPLGSGFVPAPVNPGMLLTPPSLIPWNNGYAGNQFSQPTNQSVAPANQIDLPNNEISLPVTNSSALPPGALNAQVRGVIPHAPSTPGADPGMLRPPSFNNGAAGSTTNQNYSSAGVLTSVGSNGQLPDLLTKQGANQRNARMGTGDYGLKRTTFGFRAQFDNSNGQSVFQQWVPKPGYTVNDFGLGVNALQARDLSGSKMPPQTSFDAPRPATYPSPAISGVPPQNAPGNHTTNRITKSLLTAQVTNDLFGVPMINLQKITTSSSGAVSLGSSPPPKTTIANY